MSVRTPVYLDHQATTPIDPRVLELLAATLRDHYGNPASATHAFGWAAARLVEEARAEVAALIGATPREIVFTAGATEADNLALKGVAEAWSGPPGHLVAGNLEHEAVAGPLAQLAARGWRIGLARADCDGVVAPEAVADALRPDTVLVSVMAAQNELGTVQPVRAIGALCKRRGVLFHTDAAQAAGKVPLDVAADGIDLLSLSGHKMYGPKGIGALYVRRRDPRVTLAPQLAGGGQERGLRAGTLNVPGIVALGEACRLARLEMADDAARLDGLAQRLWARLREALPGLQLNGAAAPRLPGCLNLSFAGVPARRLLSALTVLAVSGGAACASEEGGASPVLLAIGVPERLARASLRLGLGRFTTADEVDFAADAIIAAVRRLRGEASAAGLADEPSAGESGGGAS